MLYGLRPVAIAIGMWQAQFQGLGIGGSCVQVYGIFDEFQIPPGEEDNPFYAQYKARHRLFFGTKWQTMGPPEVIFSRFGMIGVPG